MTQQINLYDERLRPRHEVATARNLGISAAVLFVAVSVFAVYARINADRQAAELTAVQANVRTEQELVTALAKSVAERKVAPALSAELARSRNLLQARQEVMDVLTSGRIGNAEGFSGVMFGFARQAQSDVWLTGFSATGGGEEIEIRGRLLDPARLPAYVQRLSSEPVFHGRRFATLDMRDVEPEALKAGALVVAPSVAKPAELSPPQPPRYVEFALRSAHAVSPVVKDAGAAAGGQR
jgi:transposase-like protein